MWLYVPASLLSEVLCAVGIPMFCIALAGLAGFLVWMRPAGWRSRLTELALALALFLAAVQFARWDPHRVVEWFLD